MMTLIRVVAELIKIRTFWATFSFGLLTLSCMSYPLGLALFEFLFLFGLFFLFGFVFGFLG